MSELSDLAATIRHRYKYATRPTDDEVRAILARIAALKNAGLTIDEAQLEQTIKSHLKDTRVIVLDSVDMSPTVSILKQIMTAAGNPPTK